MGAIPVLRFATLSPVSLAQGSPIWCDIALAAKHLSASCWNMEVMVGRRAWILFLPVEKCVANPCPVGPQISSTPVKSSAMRETVGHALEHQLFPADAPSEQRSSHVPVLKVKMLHSCVTSGVTRSDCVDGINVTRSAVWTRSTSVL